MKKTINAWAAKSVFVLSTLVLSAWVSGCCIGSNKASWAANDTGQAVVDVNQRLPNGQKDNGVVRSGPGFEFGKVTSLPSGTVVTVVENKKGSGGMWSKINYAGGTGWMHQDILLKAREIQAGGHADFSGTYTQYLATGSGVCTFKQVGVTIHGDCNDGEKITCTVGGNNANCNWAMQGGGGKAYITKTANGTIVGTWGNGNSSTDGGAWQLVPR